MSASDIQFEEPTPGVLLITHAHDGPDPHHLPVMRELLRRCGDKIKAGRQYRVEAFHDGWCAQLNGKGHCNCEPECRLLEISPPEFN